MQHRPVFKLHPVQLPVKPPLVDDWDLYQHFLSHTFSRHIKCKPEEHPVLMSEATVSGMGKLDNEGEGEREGKGGSE